MQQQRECEDINQILRGSQARLCLGVQILTNFLQHIPEFRTSNQNENELRLLVIQCFLTFLNILLGPLTRITIPEE